MNTKQQIIKDILFKSQGHQITYKFGDDDGTLKEDKAIPVGWFKEWLLIALLKRDTFIVEELEKLKVWGGGGDNFSDGYNEGHNKALDKVINLIKEGKK